MKTVGKAYWNGVWQDVDLPAVLNPHNRSLRHHVNRCLHDYLKERFRDLETQGTKLLEVGCARSQLLPYFAREFGFEVHGIDFSETGCEMARAILKREAVDGTIYLADFFAPSSELLSQFDVVFSYGVAEHFPVTESCLSAFAAFLKPDGMLVTIVPNMVGFIGTVQKLINRPIYDIHIPLDTKMLEDAHKKAGCRPLACDYLISSNFGVCNLIGVKRFSISWPFKKALLTGLIGFSVGVWFMERVVGKFKPTRALSAYVTCVAVKRG